MGSNDTYRDGGHGRNLIKLLHAIDQLSRSGGTTIKELQERLGVSRRSVYRMFDVLEALHFPLLEDDRPGEKEKRWSLQEDFLHRMPNLRIPDMKLTARELLVLLFLLRQDHVLANTTLANLVHSIRNKISAIMPSEYLSLSRSEKLDTLFVSGSLHPVSYEGMGETIDRLLQAVLERRVCTASYRALSHGRVKTYTIHPLRLFQHDGALHLFVAIPERDVVRILAVHRICSLTVEDGTFSDPDLFDPDEMLGHTFNLTLNDPVSATIRFSPAAARRVRDRGWSATQTLTEQPDGSVVLSFETSGRDDLVAWVLSFGGGAVVLDPPELRDLVAERAREIASLYP